jgi:hypothetical protein
VDGPLVVAGEEVAAVNGCAAAAGADPVVQGRFEVGDRILLVAAGGRLADVEVVDGVSGLQDAAY